MCVCVRVRVWIGHGIRGEESGEKGNPWLVAGRLVTTC